MAINYFYDGQLKRYREQFGRIFSTIQCQAGVASDGSILYKTVPAIPASADLQAMNIIMNNSENTIQTVPMFAYYITEMNLAPERRQNPTYVRQLGVTYRDVDPLTGKMTGKVGNQYLVENYMPVPYDVTFRLDLWYTNDTNKEEIAEQIQTLFNPMIDIQTNRNMLDWSSLTVVELTGIAWNPPMYGAGGTLPTTRVVSWTFRVPIWLNPPSKVKRSNKINEIIISIGEGDEMPSNMSAEDPFSSYFNDSTSLARTVVTPGNFKIFIRRNYSDKDYYTAQLVIEKGNETDENGVPWTWPVLLQKYGKINDGDSSLLLMTNLDNLDHDTEYNPSSKDNDDSLRIIAGKIALDSTDPSILYYNIDPTTLPQAYNETISINSCIDPSKEKPLEGREKCNNMGITYMTLNTIPQGSMLWGTIYQNGYPIQNITAAVQGDILQYDGEKWIKIFDSVASKDSIAYAMNVCNGDYFTFENGQWRMTVDGEYNPGYWRLRL